MSFSWICPYCNQHATITEEQYNINSYSFQLNNKEGWLSLFTKVRVCPNSSCKEYNISTKLHKGHM